MRPKQRHRESYSYSGSTAGRPRRADVVTVHVNSNDNTWFVLILTRVPCIGEEVECEGETFKVVSVLHCAVTPEGVSQCGADAIIDVEIQPEDPPSPRRKVKAASRG